MKKPSWKLRRRAVFGSLFFCAAVVIWVIIRWEDTRLAETLVLSAFGLAGAIIASYIGGAAYEDVRLHKPLKTQREKEDDGSFIVDVDE
jgi:multisubunit Na+/H+ antiporter MnhG subunit